jgi:hypothetical protein
MIIAMAALHDPAKSLYSDEAYKYFSLAKACLASKCVVENSSIPALQALVRSFQSLVSPDSLMSSLSQHLMVLFILMGNRKPESSWMYLGIATHCAYSVSPSLFHSTELADMFVHLARNSFVFHPLPSS